MPAAGTKFLPFLFCIVLVSCGRPSGPNKFSDETVVRIADLQDRRITDSLSLFLTHPDVSYRRQAALAFASVQDSAASEVLGQVLLHDEDRMARINAAYALGQTGGHAASEFLFQAYALERDSLALQTILESIGKVADAADITLANFEGPGVPWLCYRLGLRQVTPPEFNERVADYLSQEYDVVTRAGAAHFFAGSRTVAIDEAEASLVKTLRDDPASEVRMTAASALRKIDSDDALNALNRAVSEDPDYRVRINAIKSLATFPFARTREILIPALHDSVVNVSIAAAEVVQSAATDVFADEVLREARAATNWRVQALLYQGANWIDSNPEINDEIIRHYESATSNYHKAWLLTALSGMDVMPFVVQALLTSAVPVVRTSAASVLVAMNREEKITRTLQEKFLDTYTQGIATGDVAVIGLFTDALADTSLHYKDLVSDVSFLEDARRRLSLPRDYESYVPLANAIAFFKGDSAVDIPKPFNHRIDWDLVRRIPPDQQVVVGTSKGDIIITLHVEDSPGSVANFVALVDRQYFNGKMVHRVVPNFVIQDGCHRGDGWGSEDYSIRSEFTRLRYGTGSVGMASAGKDTEGTQWFITHSPPPRLDGKYTIFGTVAEGMEVVHAIEVGDTIHSMVLDPPLTR